ncbi:MAG: tRNA-dihydrouridine synthase family protein [Lachnospiraceae bacterium]|nr:tRNA-dihydrouridine synthase family protein [Lachnospiraceae bacterium]
MEIYFAPMEGMTSPLLRRNHAQCFGGCDKYYSPFISTNEAISMNNKELEDVDHEQNKGLTLIPQIISNSAYQSAMYIKLLSEKYGYDEVNINLGCPSGTVVSKGKGSGMLRDPEAMDAYLGGLQEELAKLSDEGVSIPKVSIKTRIGFYEPEEHIRITQILKSHPAYQVTVHPRTRKQMYGGEVNLDAFAHMYDELRSAGIGVVYNGDIKRPGDSEEILERFPDLDAVMIGRGLLADPSLARRIKGGEKASASEYAEYMEKILDGYIQKIGVENFILAKMKDLCNFMKPFFYGNDKGFKDMCKADTVETFRICMKQYIKNSNMIE